MSRGNILSDIDNFIGNLIDNISKEESLLFIFSPNSGEEKVNGSRLSPLILWGSNISGGILSSSTTKYPGIVSNIDIGPTVADFFDIKMEKAAGNKITWEKREDVFSFVKSINGRIDLTSKVRTRSLTSYGVISIIILLLSTFFLIIKFKADFNIKKTIKILLLFYIDSINFIVSSLLNINNIYRFFLVITIFSIVYLFIISRYNNVSTLYILTFIFYS